MDVQTSVRCCNTCVVCVLGWVGMRISKVLSHKKCTVVTGMCFPGVLKLYACCIHLLKKLSEATSDRSFAWRSLRGEKHVLDDLDVGRSAHLPEYRNLCHQGCLVIWIVQNLVMLSLLSRALNHFFWSGRAGPGCGVRKWPYP